MQSRRRAATAHAGIRGDLAAHVAGTALGAALLSAAALIAGPAVPAVAQAPDAPVMHARIDGEGAPVALLGGGLLGADGWGRVPELLAGTRRVLNLQSLAVQYGLEDRPLPDGYSIRFESQAFGRALEAAQLTAVDVIGMSHGAVIALDFALEHPSRVRSLTLVEPPAFWMLPNHGLDDPKAAEMQQLLAAFRTKTIGEADVERFRCLLADCAVQPPRRSPEWPLQVAHRNSLRALYTAGEHTDDPERLTRLTMPVLIVTGTDTVAFHRAINAALLEALPQASALEILGGHNAPVAAAGQFVTAWTSVIQNAEENAKRRSR